ncbi:MAG: Cof-type HAD-IIB family hydrolase [Blautia sp.]
MNKKIRMIGFDLDGTILDSKKRLSKENIEAVTQAVEQGVIVLPATGRPQAGVPKEVLAIPGVRYLLASNGTRIIDLTTDEVIYQMCMDHELTMRLARSFAQVTDGMWELYAEGKCFVNEETYHFVDHPAMTAEMIQYLSSTRTYVKDLLGNMEATKACAEKFQTFYENEERLERTMEILDREPEVVVTSSSPYNLEINSKKAGKGNGLLALGKILGIEKEEIMAIGDSSNDWDMLEKVGMPVVMENSDAKTKKLAKYIARSNDENGVAHVIRKFILEKE